MKGNRVLRKINLAWNNIGNEGLRSIMGGLGSQVCCIVLQHGVVCGRVWQCAVVCCSVLQCAAVCFRVCFNLSALYYERDGISVYCSLLQCVAICRIVLQRVGVCVGVCWSVLHCVAVCCIVL